MVASRIGVITTLLYFIALFALAHFGDTKGAKLVRGRARKAVYALSLGVYCTSWTFFGSVGLASSQGLDFLSIYIGPILVFSLGWPLIARIARLARSQNSTSIADFLAARYGKSEAVAAIVAVISVIGVVPYIALQLKAISASLAVALGGVQAHGAAAPAADLSLLAALLLAGFAIAFGTRRVDTAEHQDGLMLTIASESIVKLLAFIAVGLFVTYGMFNGLGDLLRRASADARIDAIMAARPDFAAWTTMTLLSSFAIILLPRQFHVAIVENRDEDDVRTAAWTFPLYLIAINLFVVPLAIAGLTIFPDGSIDRDMSVLALPLSAGNSVMTLLALLGGLSAATAMVIVESVALSIMVSNDLVMPLLLRWRGARAHVESGDVGFRILFIRRVAILFVLALAYLYFRVAGEAVLASIGLLSFACIAQIAPSFVGALFWRRGTAPGAIAGMTIGAAIWAYAFLAPSLDLGMNASASSGGLLDALLSRTGGGGAQMTGLASGVFWSLLFNCLAYVGVSLSRRPNPIERLQADIFVGGAAAPMSQAFRLWRSSVLAEEVEATLARYLGAERTREAFESFFAARGGEYDPRAEADIHLLRIAEHLLAAAIGAASSRLVLSLLLRKRNVSRKAALQLVDDASAALLYNRDILQNALDFARQGISVFDRDLRLTCWNREFVELFSLPPSIARIGVALDEILRVNAARGLYGPGAPDEIVAARLEILTRQSEPFRLRLYPSGKVIEVRATRMPDGGIVTTYTDVTAQVAAETALAATNETLERRVRERTEELTRLNAELARAKAQADEANLSKTRFLAAAGHDILQPLNAARLYAASLVERLANGANPKETGNLAGNVDASLEAVEEIFSALLEMSRLDAGAMKVELSNFRIEELFRQLRIEFEPLAKDKGLTLIFAPCSLSVRSDRRLLRRLLQNLVSNAIKYTAKGRVLIGVRRARGRMRIEVWDTGLGIPQEMQKSAFREFERLESGMRMARGLGLGLSIVERMGKVLGHRISLSSRPGKGSVFAVEAPIAAPAPAPVEQGQETTSLALARAKPLSGMNVLAIDNEPRILEGMRALLSGWGCRVIVGASLHEVEAALGLLAPLAPDAVLADFHLDDGDGVDAIVALRWKFGPDLPAALITAERGEDMRARASKKDIVLLNKPLKPAALRSLLAQWRARSAGVQASAE